MLAERFSQNPLETYFWKQHPLGAWKDNLSLYDLETKYHSSQKQQLVQEMKLQILSQIEPVQCHKKYKQNNLCDLQKFQADIRYLAIKPTQQVS